MINPNYTPHKGILLALPQLDVVGSQDQTDYTADAENIQGPKGTRYGVQFATTFLACQIITENSFGTGHLG